MQQGHRVGDDRVNMVDVVGCEREPGRHRGSSAELRLPFLDAQGFVADGGPSRIRFLPEPSDHIHVRSSGSVSPRVIAWNATSTPARSLCTANAWVSRSLRTAETSTPIAALCSRCFTSASMISRAKL